ncbi:MAG: hypothetical protein Q9P01_20975 [Anaerolineae bacterium]|nr:hypothetical protein [Anaerolineae bacterium]MDQ7037221.1 hypothetical protein [Anaerolineae bacterium]
MSDKKKNTRNRLGTTPFTILWTLAYGLGWATVILGGIITNEFFPQVFNWFPDIAYIMLAVAVPTFVYSIAQQLLMRWKFAVNFRWWFLWTTLAAVLAGASFQIFQWVDFPFEVNNPIVAVILVFGYIFGSQALVQAWLLRHRVKRVWMWPVAAIASAATFGVPLVNADFFSESALVGTFGFAGLLQGAVMALTLVWLFGMTRAEPLKRGLEATNTQEAESNLAYDDYDEAESDYPQEENMKQQS